MNVVNYAQRIKGDPSGFSPVELADDAGDNTLTTAERDALQTKRCRLCAIRQTSGCDIAPCYRWSRPGGQKGVYYVRTSATKQKVVRRET